MTANSGLKEGLAVAAKLKKPRTSWADLARTTRCPGCSSGCASMYVAFTHFGCGKRIHLSGKLIQRHHNMSE